MQRDDLASSSSTSNLSSQYSRPSSPLFFSPRETARGTDSLDVFRLQLGRNCHFSCLCTFFPRIGPITAFSSRSISSHDCYTSRVRVSFGSSSVLLFAQHLHHPLCFSDFPPSALPFDGGRISPSSYLEYYIYSLYSPVENNNKKASVLSLRVVAPVSLVQVSSLAIRASSSTVFVTSVIVPIVTHKDYLSSYFSPYSPQSLLSAYPPLLRQGPTSLPSAGVPLLHS